MDVGLRVDPVAHGRAPPAAQSHGRPAAGGRTASVRSTTTGDRPDARGTPPGRRRPAGRRPASPRAATPPARSRRAGGRPRRNAVPDRAGSAGKNATTASSPGRSADSSGPTKKSAAGTRAPCRRPTPAVDRALQQGQDRGHLGGRVGVREAAHDRAAVADRSGGRPAAAPGAAAAGRPRPPRSAPPARAGPARRRVTPARRPRSVSSPASRLMSTRCAGRGQPHVQQRDQALPAGEHLAVAPRRRGRRAPRRGSPARGRSNGDGFTSGSLARPARRVRGRRSRSSWSRSARAPAVAVARAPLGGGQRVVADQDHDGAERDALSEKSSVI